MEVRKWEDPLMTQGRSDGGFGLGDVGPMDLPTNLHFPTSIFLPNFWERESKRGGSKGTHPNGTR